MSNPVSISNSGSISNSSLNNESLSPSRLSSSPNSKSSAYELNGKRTLKSSVVKTLLNRSSSGSNLNNTTTTRRAAGSFTSNYQNLYTPNNNNNNNNNDDDAISVDGENPPDSPKSTKDHSNSVGSNSGGLNMSMNSIKQQQHDNLIKQQQKDRSLWTVRSLKEHTEVLDIMERIKPVNRAISFGQIYAREETQFDFDPLIGRDTMLQLILQHLQFEGLMDSRKLLEEEAKVQYPEYAINESRLVTLLRTALIDSERVFQLTLNDKQKDSQQQLEEHLAFLGLFKDETATDISEDVNIYDEPENSNIIYVDDKDKEKEKQQQQNSTNNTGGNSPSPNIPGGIGNNSNSNYNNNGDLSPLSASTLLMMSPPNKNSIETNKPQVKAASLNKLVILLTPDNNHDLEYTKTFLLTYQSFTTPEMLLEKLVQRYHVPQKPGQSLDDWKKSAVPIQLRVANVIRTWIKDYFSDFNDKLIQNVKSLYENMKQSGNMSHAKILSESLNAKIKGMVGVDDQKRAPTFTSPAPEPKVPKNIWSQTLDIFSVDEEEIARQLTLMDFEIFSAIKSTELLNQSWNKPKLRHRSPNVLTLINRFNEISQWTATSILSYPKVKDRSRIMAKFIKIAEYCMKHLNNFNTSMAILSGLNASSVHRLKFTKEELPKHTQQVYQELQFHLSSAQAYKEYRALLAKANPPCLPYLGVYLTDLTFFEEGNPDFIQGFINFGKRKLIYGSISNVQSFQNAKYNLQPVYQITKLLKGFKLLEENDLYSRSMSFEPRNKERNEIL
ncbi:hypothetical protein RB653_004821 [Dictyostelium firmibasis]|uniref:Uncharacterized protein n=1 Tax=Dictyostelium firmibasis TaxID=79012 RepID=A0AAN7UB78_9MYCE